MTNVKLDSEWLGSAFPEHSAVFDLAVDRTLNRIHTQAELERQMARKTQLRRVGGWALAGLLALAGVLGVAEGARLGVFDFLLGREDVLPQADELVRKDAAAMRIGQTELAATETVFDGAALRITLSVRRPDIGRPLTAEDLDADGDFARALADDGVTALGGFDWFTVDGIKYGMTAGSGGETVTGKQDGEAAVYFELRFADTPLPDKDFTVGLPLGGNGAELLNIPIVRASTAAVRDATPAEPFAVGGGTLTVLKAALSPIRTYVTIRLDFPESVGEEAAQPYLDAWRSYCLADAQGNAACELDEPYGDGLPAGETDDARHLWVQAEGAPVKDAPETLYLAPIAYDEQGGLCADMSLAVPLAEEKE